MAIPGWVDTGFNDPIFEQAGMDDAATAYITALGSFAAWAVCEPAAVAAEPAAGAQPDPAHAA